MESPLRFERELPPSHWSRLALAVPSGLCLAICSCWCQPPTPPTPVDSCPKPVAGRVDSVEIAATRLRLGSYGFDQGADDAPPRRLTPDERLWWVQGGQGLDMVGLRLVLAGTDVPDCIEQDTQVMVNGVLAGRNRVNVATHAIPGGGRATKTLWVVGNFQSQAVLRTTAAGATASVPVITALASSCESMQLCPCSKALDCQCSGGLSDAGQLLWREFGRCLSESCDGGAGGDAWTCQQAARADGGVCEGRRRACEEDLL